MGLLNRKKNNSTTNVYDKCLDLVKMSTVPTNQIEMIMDQIKLIIDELEAIGQPTDELEIVSEVLDQNDYEFINSKQAKLIERTLKVNKGGRELALTNEQISKLNFEVKLGGAILDLRNFEFAGGDLLLNINASFSGVEIYVNDDVAVHDWIENKYSGVDYTYNGQSYNSANRLPKFETNHAITIEGKIKGSGVSIIIGHQGEVAERIKHHGNELQNLSQDHIDQQLAEKLDKIEAKAERQKSKLKNKLERKKDRLARKGR